MMHSFDMCIGCLRARWNIHYRSMPPKPSTWMILNNGQNAFVMQVLSTKAAGRSFRCSNKPWPANGRHSYRCRSWCTGSCPAWYFHACGRSPRHLSSKISTRVYDMIIHIACIPQIVAATGTRTDFVDPFSSCISLERECAYQKETIMFLL